MYNYAEERPYIFTEEGQVMFLKIRDTVQQLLRIAGAFQMEKALKETLGSAWSAMACVDRLVELKEIREISQPNCAGQYRTFVRA